MEHPRMHPFGCFVKHFSSNRRHFVTFQQKLLIELEAILQYILHSTLEHTDFAQARPSGGVATLDSYVFLCRTDLYLLSLLTFRPLFTLTTVRSRVWDVTVIPWKLPRPIACGSNCG